MATGRANEGRRRCPPGLATFAGSLGWPRSESRAGTEASDPTAGGHTEKRMAVNKIQKLKHYYKHFNLKNYKRNSFNRYTSPSKIKVCLSV